jgi:uncharacterized membrane protein YdbT with pleckstrin-like domain
MTEAVRQDDDGNILTTDDERMLRVIRPATFRAHPLTFIGLMVVLFGSVGGAIWAWFFSGTMQWLAVVFGATAAAALIGWACWKIWTLSLALRITTVRTIEDRGFFSRRTSEVLHENIRNVQISQSFWDRIWGVGMIEIASAGHEGFEITFKDVPRPYEVRKLIDEHREFNSDD